MPGTIFLVGPGSSATLVMQDASSCASPFSYSVTPGANWLGVNPAAGKLTPGGTVVFTVSVLAGSPPNVTSSTVTVTVDGRSYTAGVSYIPF